MKLLYSCLLLIVHNMYLVPVNFCDLGIKDGIIMESLIWNGIPCVELQKKTLCIFTTVLVILGFPQVPF